MKKILSLCTVLCLAGFALFSEQSYSVKAVSGMVNYRQKDGSWAPVKVGMDLPDSAKVYTGLNSTMVVYGEEKTIVILPLKTGNVSEVAARCSDDLFLKTEPVD